MAKRRATSTLTGGSCDINPQYVTENFFFTGGNTTEVTGYKGLLFHASKLLNFPGTVLVPSCATSAILVPEIIRVVVTGSPGGRFTPALGGTADIAVDNRMRIDIGMGDTRSRFLQQWGPDTDEIRNGGPLNNEFFTTDVIPDSGLLWSRYFWHRSTVYDQDTNSAFGSDFNDFPLYVNENLTDATGHGIICYSNVITLALYRSSYQAGTNTIIQMLQGRMKVRLFYRLKKINVNQLLIGQQTFSVTL